MHFLLKHIQVPSHSFNCAQTLKSAKHTSYFWDRDDTPSYHVIHKEHAVMSTSGYNLFSIDTEMSLINWKTL